jgi:hypothetical protein
MGPLFSTKIGQFNPPVLRGSLLYFLLIAADDDASIHSHPYNWSKNGLYLLGELRTFLLIFCLGVPRPAGISLFFFFAKISLCDEGDFPLSQLSLFSAFFQKKNLFFVIYKNWPIFRYHFVQFITFTFHNLRVIDISYPIIIPQISYGFQAFLEKACSKVRTRVRNYNFKSLFILSAGFNFCKIRCKYDFHVKWPN